MTNMTIEEICKVREDINKVVDAHPDELKETLASALQECGDLGDADEIRRQYDALVVPGRQLHIGIVGRVKAGKSSMLNSLFFGGKNVLPKAATPMTAALTKLRYSEKPVVKINFIDANDKAKIEQKAADYKRLFNSKVEGMLKDKRERAELKKQPFDEAEQRKKCEKSARSDLSENNVVLAGAAEQAEMLQKASSSVLQMLGKSVEKKLDRIEDVAKELAGYVGADGEYTPITRDVELGFPFDALKDITVVDTPGFDDPVPSRDAAARDSLKKCDAIFILSPAGQFCNEEDRTNMEKIESGEGIQNISVVASKIDAELGNESKDEADGDIQKELTLIVRNISETLRKLADGFPRDGMLHKKLTEDLGRGLLYTSGICQSM
ncbi:MAG: dynamin family protein, partial [Treponema sp.]|nr:dynamin family protein [Treponema sp.]